MGERRRSWWGWGWEDEALTPEQAENLAVAVAERLGLADVQVARSPSLDDVALPVPRLSAPDSLAHLCSSTPYDRASHTYGKSFRDIVRGFHGELRNPPDVVAFPTTEAEVVDVIDWCASAGAAAVPYGGGSSVVGGVECAVGEGYSGAVSIDLTRLDRVVEVDTLSRAARIQGGAMGPVLEEQLRPHGLTLRHFPQSFEFSTLGGWLATRSGGHYATVYTHIDDLVESMRTVTPAGVLESRRLPGSGAGPSPDRMILGSEGTLGIITEAWMRVQEKPRFRASAAVHFDEHPDGVEAIRELSQSGLFPTNCRLLDAGEALLTTGTEVKGGLLLLGFESADHPVDAWIERAVELCADHGGAVPDGIRHSSREGSVGAWRNAFLRAPYTRDALVAMGMIVETFETACTWSAFGDLHSNVKKTVEKALESICGGGWVTCRFTHVYPDGPAPYFSVMAPSRHGSQIAMWDEIKAAVAEILLAESGTITHHHAIGRDHRPWYDRQRPDLFAAALRAAKQTLDPEGILNPGVLLDAPR
jgi:alkyldihydroxyacetonephosphate synthase